MSALSAKVEVQRKDVNILQHKVAAVKVYEGGLCKLNAAGFLAPCSAESGAVFAGVCIETKDNSGGSAGDLKARVYKDGIFLLTGSGFAQTDVGQAVYATDDQTITKTNAADKQRVGVIAEYESSTQVWVRIMPQVFGLEAHIADATDAASAITQLNLALAAMRKHKMVSES